MNVEALFYKLVQAEDELEVEKILEKEGLGLANEAVWHPLGGMENNFSTVGNQHAEATGALVEKLINSIDAVLMSECYKAQIGPETSDAPRTMSEAVEKFFGVAHGRLENLLSKQQTALANRINLVATGEKSTPSYMIIDDGEGQTPRSFPDTLLSLRRSNKMRIPFVQGKFNSGGTGVLQFCGEKNMQLIASRRNPSCVSNSADGTASLWGFTIVRRLRPSSGRRSSVYVYLATEGDRQNPLVPNFSANGIKVLPEDRANVCPRPYSVNLTHGTCIKLYNFRWKAKSIATTEARYELERYLHAPCLPFRVTETRKYTANYYKTTVSGVWATVAMPQSDEAESTKVENGFPASGELNLHSIGKLPYRLVVFREDVDSRHIPHGVFFNINGQRHGDLPADFVSRHLKLDYLKDHLLVSVDCTGMEDTVREDFFMASRDRVRRNEVYDTIVDNLKEELAKHPGLTRINAERRKKQIEEAISNDDLTAKALAEILRSDPSLSSLFAPGDKLVTTTGPGASGVYKGRKFPSKFELAKQPKGGLVKRCPINRTCRIEFDTDAVNDYFERADSPGAITTDPPNLIERSHLWDGVFSAALCLPHSTEPGDKIEVTVTVSDVECEQRGKPFESKLTLIAEPETQDKIRQSGGPRPEEKSPGSGRRAAASLAMPEVIDERVEKEPFRVLRIAHNDSGGYDFYLNVANTFLLTELTRARDADKALVTYWFKYGITLCALGMIQQQKRAAERSTDSDSSSATDAAKGEDLRAVEDACGGIARVIVPIIRALHKGPMSTQP